MRLSFLLLSSYNTVERTAWFSLGLDVFGLTHHVIREDVTMSYFPGGDIPVSLLASEDYKRKCKTRVDKVKRFFRARNAMAPIMKAILSSIPRWRYVRDLNATPGSKSANGADGEELRDDFIDPDVDDAKFQSASVSPELRGVARAQRGFVEESRRMFSANDSLVEFFLNRESGSLQLNLEVWRSVAASALYLAEKNLPYTSNPYREVRGELDIPDYVHSVSGRPY